jgi:hypothetical protein
MPPEPQQEQRSSRGSIVLRVGAGVGASVLAASLCVVPAALRIGGGASTWVVLAALALAPMIVAVPVLRRARVGLRAFGGPHASASMLAVVLWLVALFAMLVPFGSMLRATTHHHALAGVTFALVATILALVLAAVCARVAAILAAQSERTRRALVAMVSATLAAIVLFGGMRLAHALQGAAALPPSASATFVDALAFAIAALFASRPAFSSRRALAIVGPPAAAIIIFVGLSLLRSSAGLPDILTERAPAFAAVAHLILRQS